jgi:hypothetical protein
MSTSDLVGPLATSDRGVTSTRDGSSLRESTDYTVISATWLLSNPTRATDRYHPLALRWGLCRLCCPPESFSPCWARARHARRTSRRSMTRRRTAGRWSSSTGRRQTEKFEDCDAASAGSRAHPPLRWVSEYGGSRQRTISVQVRRRGRDGVRATRENLLAGKEDSNQAVLTYGTYPCVSAPWRLQTPIFSAICAAHT